MKLKQNFISESRYDIKAPHAMKAVGICVHNTANDATAVNERAYMERNDAHVSFHVVIDDKEALHVIPFNRNAWASGDGVNGVGNRSYIHVEICYSKSGGDRFDKAEANAAKIIAQLLEEFQFPITQVKRHQDFAKKNCPERTNAKGWERFVTMIQREMDGDKLQKLKAGDMVSIIGDKWATGQTIPAWAKQKAHVISTIDGQRALLDKSGVCSWAWVSDLKKATATTAPAKKEYIQLSASETSWSIYNEAGPYVKAKAIGQLNPSKFGGLEYEVLKWAQADVAIIKTADFGRVAIYVAQSTGAKRVTK